jgi:Uma2 family endonuclease
MGTVTTLPRGRAFTREDLETMPDDGRRYELIDGSLVVTPAPALRHQRMVGALHLLLHQACLPGLEVLLAPFDVALSLDTVVQPDLLVARTADLTERDLPVAPRLAIEVLSPSTRHVDIGLKRARYETAGCPSYWVVDPDQPSITVWEIEDGRYVERAHLVGDDEYDAAAPFSVTLSPGRLSGAHPDLPPRR